jgi:hypothetical protein
VARAEDGSGELRRRSARERRVGFTGSRRWRWCCSDGERRRSVARADGRAAWHDGERPAGLGEAVALS